MAIKRMCVQSCYGFATVLYANMYNCAIIYNFDVV